MSASAVPDPSWHDRSWHDRSASAAAPTAAARCTHWQPPCPFFDHFAHAVIQASCGYAMRHHSRVSSAPHLTSSGVDARLAVSSRGSNARLAASFEDAGRDDDESALPAKAEATALHRAPTPADPPSSSEDAAAVADETKGECQRASYERRSKRMTLPIQPIAPWTLHSKTTAIASAYTRLSARSARARCRCSRGGGGGKGRCSGGGGDGA